MQAEKLKTSEHSIIKLEELFATFNQVSVDLGSRYRELETRVAELNKELAVTHSARLKELTAKEELAAKLSSLVDTLPGGVVVLDKDGVVREENAIAQQMLGSSALNRNWKSVFEALGAEGAMSGSEVSLDNGKRLCVSSSAYGDTDETIVLLTDVSENHRLRNLINREERLTALGEMAARLAHQIRTPLSTAILYLSHLPNSRIDQQTDSVAKKIQSCLRQIESLTESMLSYIRGESSKREVFSICDVLYEVKDANSLQLRDSRGDIRLELPGYECLFEGDRDALFNAISNLVENAIQASETAPLIKLSVRRETTRFRISIEDNGPGIQESMKEKIFDPFFSSRPGGTGLGLAVVHSAVKACSGQIAIKSAESGGALIEILLPREKFVEHKEFGIWCTEAETLNGNTLLRKTANG